LRTCDLLQSAVIGPMMLIRADSVRQERAAVSSGSDIVYEFVSIVLSNGKESA